MNIFLSHKLRLEHLFIIQWLIRVFDFSCNFSGITYNQFQKPKFDVSS